MAFCQNCGTEMNAGVNFCPKCGKSAGVTTDLTSPQIEQGQYGEEANKGMAIVAYLIFFIPLLTGDHKKSEFVKYHTNQGTVLFIFAIFWGIAQSIITAILASIMLTSYNLMGFYTSIIGVLGLTWLVVPILIVLGIVYAVKGEMKPLPVIGRIKIIK